MEIKEFINSDLIKMNLESRDKNNVLKELVEVLFENNIVDDKEKVYQKALEREKKGTTGVGHGVAIPHVKSSAVKKASIVFAKSEEGVDFESMDNEDTYLFFMIAVPDEADKQHLKLLSKLSRKLMHKKFRQALKKASSKKELMEVITKKD